GIAATLESVVTTLEEGLGKAGRHQDVSGAIAKVDALSPAIAVLEQQGMSQRYIVRMRNQQDHLRDCLYRISYMQKMQFVPSIHVLVESLLFGSLILLLFVQTGVTLQPRILL